MLSQKQEQETLTRELKIPETGTEQGGEKRSSIQSVLLVVVAWL